MIFKLRDKRIVNTEHTPIGNSWLFFTLMGDLMNRWLTAEIVENSHKMPHNLATGRYCDETVDDVGLKINQIIYMERKLVEKLTYRL